MTFEMNKLLNNYKIFVAGHKGMVGKSLMRHFKKKDSSRKIDPGHGVEIGF